MNEITQLKNICEVLEGRRKKADALKVRYDRLGEEICMALELNLVNCMLFRVRKAVKKCYR
jgi:hypothetical protein